MGINIIVEKCVGCGVCVSVCPFQALELVNGKVVVNEACTLCGICVDACKFDALELPKVEQAPTVHFDDYRGVWVFIQHDNGTIHHVSLELIGEGKKLAEKLGTTVSCLVCGNSIDGIIEEISRYDIETIYIGEHAALEWYSTQPYIESSAHLIRTYKPEIVLIGATSTGRDFAGGLATELRTGLTADCTDLDIENKTRNLLQTRPAFGGNIMATIKSSSHRPQMATVRPKVFPLPSRGEKRTVNVIKNQIIFSDSAHRTEILDWIPIKEKVNLADADIIVSGGRGMGKPDNFALLQELASLLGGAVGASRAAVDAGWMDYSHQVGQTGRTVRPKVYIACGISGAVQHLAGMKTSDVIIAINRDPDAPIFKVATYGFVGDVLEIIPKVIQEVKKRGTIPT